MKLNELGKVQTLTSIVGSSKSTLEKERRRGKKGRKERGEERREG